MKEELHSVFGPSFYCVTQGSHLVFIDYVDPRTMFNLNHE